MRKVSVVGWLAFMGSLSGLPVGAQMDLGVSKTAPNTVAAGSNLTYSIAVENTRPKAANDVTLNDPLPSNTTFVSARQISGPAFTITSPAVGANGTVSASIATLKGLNIVNQPYGFVAVGNKVFFAANGDGGYELWKSDGTPADTEMVKDINPNGDASILELTNVNGTLFFIADDGNHGREFWKSDGTPAGTVLVKDINPGSEGSRPQFMGNLGGTLFFRADNGSNGIELWKSDGTATGTQMVRDIYPGSNSSIESLGRRDFISFNGALFFLLITGCRGGNSGRQMAPHRAPSWLRILIPAVMAPLSIIWSG